MGRGRRETPRVAHYIIRGGQPQESDLKAWAIRMRAFGHDVEIGGNDQHQTWSVTVYEKSGPVAPIPESVWDACIWSDSEPTRV